MLDKEKIEREVASMSVEELEALAEAPGMFDGSETPEVCEQMIRELLASNELHRRRAQQAK